MTQSGESSTARPQTEDGTRNRTALDRAERLRCEGDVAGAIRVLLDALEYGEERATVYYRLGNLFVDGGDLGRAEAAYKRALEVDPRHANAMHNLAVVYKRQNRIGLFVKTYKESQRLALATMTTRDVRSYWPRSPWLRYCAILIVFGAVIALVLMIGGRSG